MFMEDSGLCLPILPSSFAPEADTVRDNDVAPAMAYCGFGFCYSGSRVDWAICCLGLGANVGSGRVAQ